MSGSYDRLNWLGISAVLITWWAVLAVVVLMYMRRHEDDWTEES